MPDELDPRLLRYFVAVAEELHFTRAAARLYGAQQALSRDIARLERQLGVRLFTRTTRRVALTREGQRLLVRARELLALREHWRELPPGAWIPEPDAAIVGLGAAR
jgi:DNA-binding transcriptional LysR family regulator